MRCYCSNPLNEQNQVCNIQVHNIILINFLPGANTVFVYSFKFDTRLKRYSTNTLMDNHYSVCQSIASKVSTIKGAKLITLDTIKWPRYR